MRFDFWTSSPISVLVALSLSIPTVARAAQAESVQVQTGTSAATANPATFVQPTPDPVQNCLAAQSENAPVKKKKKRGPVRFVAKAIASELGTDGSDMLKDTAFVFSAKDFDPYEKKPPTDKPYTALELELVDGSSAEVIKYPDRSCKVVGSYLDGTIIAPCADGSYIVAYPNGVRSKMSRVSPVEYKIYRPDKTVTTMRKTGAGNWEISNTKIGFIGTAQPDTEGMQFEFHSRDF